MQRENILIIIILIVISTKGFSQDDVQKISTDEKLQMFYNDFYINPKTSEVIESSNLKKHKAISLKDGIEEDLNRKREEDISIKVDVPEKGKYILRTYAAPDSIGASIMSEAKNKYESLFMGLKFGSSKFGRKVIYVPWGYRKNADKKQEIGIFDLEKGEEQIKIWLPKGIHLGYIEIEKHSSPKVPSAAKNYTSEYVPPKSRPRLWVNKKSLPKIRKNLDKGENKEIWNKVKETAKDPVDIDYGHDKTPWYDPHIENIAEKKAFYYLMTDDKKVGAQAKDIMLNYLPKVEFGNVLDITRQRGRAIYKASLVYDWTYDLLDSKEREILRKHMMRLAYRMEIGWPPFKTGNLIGHGAELQVNRDFLSMSIAIYDEDPKPYKFVSFLMEQKLIPHLKYVFQSPKHSEGTMYGPFRHGMELTAAWLLKRMTGKEVFDDNIKDVAQSWLYQRLPNEERLRDGDDSQNGTMNNYQRDYAYAKLMAYSYNNDSLMKGEFFRENPKMRDVKNSDAQIGKAQISSDAQITEPLFLLVNNLTLPTEKKLDSLSLTKSFGPHLGSMIVRTGWNTDPNSNDVIAEIKGGGYNFGNHQHADAGALQVYYKGFQLGDLGLYGWYGTPYDLGFNKRSNAHSMMLVHDPDEKFGRSEANDGGSRLVQGGPRSLEEFLSNPKYDYGTVKSTGFGPSEKTPMFSYFSTDIENAYSDKVEKFRREFIFGNLKRDDVPAFIILKDNIKSSDSTFNKYWQVNSVNPPEITNNGLILQNEYKGNIGKTHIDMLYPKKGQRAVKVLKDKEAISAFNMKFDDIPDSDLPERHGNRTLISPSVSNYDDYFLTIFQMVDGKAKPLKYKHTRSEMSDIFHIDNKLISVNKNRQLIDKKFQIELVSDKKTDVFLTGLKKGEWVIESDDDVRATKKVKRDENTLYLELNKKGTYTISPKNN